MRVTPEAASRRAVFISASSLFFALDTSVSRKETHFGDASASVVNPALLFLSKMLIVLVSSQKIFAGDVKRI